MIEIDGSYGEGGGQLTRTAVALAAITRTPVRIVNVRARRGKPGLAPQHLAALRAVSAVCSAATEGLELGSTAVAFDPGALEGGAYRFDVGTAGSVTLVLQAVLPVLLASRVPSSLGITGGTDIRQSPPIDYLGEVLLRHLARMGAAVRLGVTKRGYYPRGGGEVAVEIASARLHPLRAPSAGALRAVRGIAHVSNLPAHIPERMRDAALGQLGAFRAIARIATPVLADADAIGRGGAIVVWAETEYTVLGAARVAERGVRAEALGEAVGWELRTDLDAGVTVDRHAADQLLVYLALAGGESTFTVRELTSHTRTAMWLIGRFLPVRFVEERLDGIVRVRVLR
ncbi:MAG: RNA 3'-terminal phosphate cyclase [Betaproteobacteria bacterium]|nr:RNA 3'-terminal phosphate cyclase [Betaproteobacteria bacterium]